MSRLFAVPLLALLTVASGVLCLCDAQAAESTSPHDHHGVASLVESCADMSCCADDCLSHAEQPIDSAEMYAPNWRVELDAIAADGEDEAIVVAFAATGPPFFSTSFLRVAETPVRRHDLLLE